MFSSSLYQQPIVVIGAGSIGERHIRNLWQQGFKNIIVFRQRNLPFRDIADAQVKVVLHWQQVLQHNPFAAIVCTPTVQHLRQVISCLEAGIHVLAEKPLAHEPFDVKALLKICQEHKVLLQVGYMMHYHPFLARVQSFLKGKKYGKLINMQTYWGEYLPDWHPWEDYRTSYAAQREQGGGVALTLSHDIDVALWMANAALKHYQSTFNYASRLKVNTESLFDVNLSFENKVTAHVHVNFCQKVPQRWYKFIFDNAVIDIDYFINEMKVQTAETSIVEKLEQFDRNLLFITQQNDFFRRIEEGNYQAFVEQQVEQSYNIIKICTHE
ncbi:MAG: Gfo/Idh/MocA family oxidoreductase [Bacteroidota bacterium]|nr:Gfo/Idh/MocA family oxidoreductase [Bacteroidota bacterium]